MIIIIQSLVAKIITLNTHTKNSKCQHKWRVKTSLFQSKFPQVHNIRWNKQTGAGSNRHRQFSHRCLLQYWSRTLIPQHVHYVWQNERQTIPFHCIRPKRHPAVNFISIWRTCFCTKVFEQLFSTYVLALYYFGAKILYKKCVCKMLMKSTAVVNYTNTLQAAFYLIFFCQNITNPNWENIRALQNIYVWKSCQ